MRAARAAVEVVLALFDRHPSWFVFLAMSLALAVAAGCKQRADGPVASGLNADGTTPAAGCVRADFISDTSVLEFQRVADETCPNPDDPSAPVPSLRLLFDGMPVCDEGLSLDGGRVQQGEKWYTVFTWPKDSEPVPAAARDRQARVLALMRQYGELVSDCRNALDSPGELDWGSRKRREDFTQIWAAAGGGDLNQYCAAVRRRIVETYVKPGSSHIQYGNGGETTIVGACLALRFGYRPDEVRICAAGDRHNFALIKDQASRSGRWCIIERAPYERVEPYCDMDVDAGTIVRRVGSGQDEHFSDAWHENIRCQELKAYVQGEG